MNQKDPSNFRQFILQTPDQFEIGLNLAKNVKLEGEFNGMTVSGMGGSALPVNLLKAYLKDQGSNTSVCINRTYSLPNKNLSKYLNIISSYSGNTEETISSLEELHSKNLPFIGISSGGKVEELCKEYSMPHIKLPMPFPNYQPRMGTGYFFGAMLGLFINHNLVNDVSEEIVNKAKNFHTYMDQYEQKGKELSQQLKGKTPVIYSSSKNKAVAMVWKIKINENSKTPAFWNFFPELNHNEMVGYTNPQSKFFLIMLKDEADNPKNLRRYEATKSLLQEQGIESEIINMDGEDAFSKMFLSITLADWTSYYLALEYNQDPTPVEMVEKLKKILAS